MLIYIDLETIPDQREGALSEFQESVKAPAQYKKAESIAAWIASKGKQAAEDNWRKTSFDGGAGEIACISWALDDGETNVVGRPVGGDEKEMIQLFFNRLRKDISISRGDYRQVPQELTWVGHNVIGFDLRFLWLRCVILEINTHGIKIPLNARHGYKGVFDTMVAWRGQYAKAGGSMAAVCKSLGLEGKGDIDGSQVWDYMKAGKHDDVFQYCKDDVNRTRQMYNRMNAIPT